MAGKLSTNEVGSRKQKGRGNPGDQQLSTCKIKSCHFASYKLHSDKRPLWLPNNSVPQITVPSLLSADFPLFLIWSFKSLCSIRTAGKPPSYLDASFEITALLPGCLWGSAERTCLIFRLLDLHGSCRHFRCDHGEQDA